MLDIAHSVQHGLVWLHARPRVRVDDLAPKEAVVARLIAKGKPTRRLAGSSPRACHSAQPDPVIHQKLATPNAAQVIDALRLAP